MPKRHKPPAAPEPPPHLASRFMCLYRPGPGVSLTSRAEQGDAEAQFALGRLYFEGRVAQSGSRRFGGDNGDVVASYTPAFERHYLLAAEWLEKAAEQGHTEAQQLLEVVKLQTKQGVH